MAVLSHTPDGWACALLAVQYEALAYLAAGFGVLGLVGLAAKYNDKASKVPFVSSLIPTLQDASQNGDHLPMTVEIWRGQVMLDKPCFVDPALEEALLGLCALGTTDCKLRVAARLDAQVPKQFPYDQLAEELGGEHKLPPPLHAEEG